MAIISSLFCFHSCLSCFLGSKHQCYQREIVEFLKRVIVMLFISYALRLFVVMRQMHLDLNHFKSQNRTRLEHFDYKNGAVVKITLTVQFFNHCKILKFGFNNYSYTERNSLNQSFANKAYYN